MGELDFDKAQPQAASIGHTRLGYEATWSILTELRSWEKELRRCGRQGETRPPEFGTRAAAMLAIDVEWMRENAGPELPDSPVHFDLLYACLDKLCEAVYLPELERALYRVRDAISLLGAYWGCPPAVAFGVAPVRGWRKDNLDRAATLLAGMKTPTPADDVPQGCLVEAGQNRLDHSEPLVVLVPNERRSGGYEVRFFGEPRRTTAGQVKALKAWAVGQGHTMAKGTWSDFYKLLRQWLPGVDVEPVRNGKANDGALYLCPAGLRGRIHAK